MKNNFHCYLLLAALCLAVLFNAGASTAVLASTIQSVTFRGFPAYQMTDGCLEAVVVPALGRVMRFGLVGGRNWLFNPMKAPQKIGGMLYWGGAQTWLGPQSDWPALAGHTWPPDLTWADPTKPPIVELEPGGALRLIGQVSITSGMRIIRDFTFDKVGDFTVTQTVEKVTGTPEMASIWSVTSINRPDAAFLLTDPSSPYLGGIYQFGRDKDLPAGYLVHLPNDVVELLPSGVDGLKTGVDSPVSVIAVVFDSEIFTQVAVKTDGNYPDGSPSAGANVQLFDSGTGKAQPYDEVELLSPLRLFSKGEKWSFEVTWSLQRLSRNALSHQQATPELLDALRQIFAH